MSNAIQRTVALWDTVNWTKHTFELGSDDGAQFTAKIKYIISMISKKFDGSSIIDTGDGGYILFENSANAINFCVTVLQYFKLYSSGYDQNAKIRVLLSSGEFYRDENGSYQGESLAIAARLGGATSEMCLSIDEKTYALLSRKNKDIISASNLIIKKFKGLNDVGYYEVDWEKYGNQRPQDTLDSAIRSVLHSADITLSSDKLRIFDQGNIYWPVVPREELTAIHRAQIEVIKFFAFIGWKLHVLFIDYGSSETNDQSIVRHFKGLISKYLTRRKFSPATSYHQLSSLITPRGEFCCEVRTILENYIGKIPYAAFANFNRKSYDKDFIQNIESKTVSRHMRPLYTIVALTNIINKERVNSIVLSGADESSYWDQMSESRSKPQHYITIPILRGDKQHQLIQSKKYPSWPSLHKFIDDMNNALNSDEQNLVEWIYKLFLVLPSFIGDDYAVASQSVVDLDFNDRVNVDAISRAVFPLLDLS